MPDEPRRIYWDACVFLDYIEGTPKWMPILDALLDEASTTGQVVIYTSTVSITEVAYAKTERAGGTLDPAIEVAIDALWSDRSAVRLVEFSEVIARAARALQRRAILERRGSLRSVDAIHLATAQNRGVAEFHTTDERLLKHWQGLGFLVREPFTMRPKLFPT